MTPASSESRAAPQGEPVAAPASAVDEMRAALDDALLGLARAHEAVSKGLYDEALLITGCHEARARAALRGKP